MSLLLFFVQQRQSGHELDEATADTIGLIRGAILIAFGDIYQA
jgi:hypothetical protein